VAVLVGVILLIFVVFFLIGVNPERAISGQRTDEATQLAIKKEYGLDKPWHQRFGTYLSDIAPLWVHEASDQKEYAFVPLFHTSDDKVLALKFPYLGRSFATDRRVNDVLGKALLNTVVLAVTAILLALFIGINLGVLAAIKHNTWIDRTALLVSSLGVSVPSYFSAIILSFLFGYVLKEFTGLNMIGSLYDVRGNLQLQNLVLPALALGVRPVAMITQLTRSTMLDVLSADYIRTATAKGLPPRRVLFRHALRNALNPVITSVSGWLASLLAGSYFVEVIFDFKGIGYVTVRAIEQFDFPVIMGSVLFAALIFTTVNIIVDVLYAATDPRVRLRG
jgi:peptide/nickel transport system permease protein